MTNSDIKKLGMIYESHFYNDLPQDQQNLYYSGIKNEITPFVELCHDIAVRIEELSRQIDSLPYLDEYNNLKNLIENNTENPEVEMKEILGFLLGKRQNLKHCSYELSKDNVSELLIDILTGNKIQ